MADIRACEQCGTEFTPRREHARFCSAGCRMAWNRGDTRHSTVSLAALDWSVNAMAEVTLRMAVLCADWADGPGEAASDREVTAVSDATWWVTLVDATLVRYFPGGYDATLNSLPAAEREAIEQTLAGLRYVRNQMGVHVEAPAFLSGLAWACLPEPDTRELTPRGQEWERSRYCAYQKWLAGQPVARAFTMAARFLRLVASRPAEPAEPGPAVPHSPMSA